MSGFHRMVDMARSPEEVKKDLMPMAASSPEITAPVYPYGLCISLGEDEIDKLNVDVDGCAVGDMIHLSAMAKVTSYSESEYEKPDGTRKRCCRIELQITHLGLEDEDREDAEPAQRARRRYGGGDDDVETSPAGDGKAGEMHVEKSGYAGGKSGKPSVKRYSAEGEAHLSKGSYKAA